jgi:Zn-dependent protease with chaperone function
VPRQLLDLLSRAELDALVAYQLRRPRARGFWAYGFFVVLACGTGCSVALNLLKIGFAGRWAAFAFLAIAEIAVLVFVWRRRIDGHDRWAMKITGDPEAYLSAMAALSRLSTGAPDSHLIHRLARIADLPPDRIHALMQERPRPAEERYPTVGDYMTVGF